MTNRQWFFMGLALVAFGAAGCGPDIAGICDEQESCLGGNDADIDACNAAYSAAYDLASDIGCGDELEAYLNCLQPELECIGANTCNSNNECGGSGACVGGECKFYGLDQGNQDACEAEQNAYNRCN